MLTTTTWGRWQKVMQILFLSAFVLIFVFSSRLLWLRRSEDFSNLALQTVAAKKDHLPNQIGEWLVVNFEHKVRNDAFGPESSMWTVRHGNQEAIVSIDGPYSDYHTLEVCYANIGWVTKVEYDYDPSRQWDANRLNATTVEMSKPDAYGLVMFSAVDRTGLLVPSSGPLTARLQRRKIADNVRAVLGLTTDTTSVATGTNLPVYQIQVLYQSNHEITRDDQQQIQALFTTARKAFLDMERFHSGSTSGEAVAR